MLKDVSCFLVVQYNRKWKNLSVLVAPRVNLAATHLCLLHATASNVSFCHVPPYTAVHRLHITNDHHHICVCSSEIPAPFWLWADVHFTSYVEVYFGRCYPLTVLLCRYPAEPLAAALLQLHGTICWWAAVLCPRLRHHTPDTSLWWTCQENGN